MIQLFKYHISKRKVFFQQTFFFRSTFAAAAAAAAHETVISVSLITSILFN